MGYHNEVAIKCEQHAYELIKAVVDKKEYAMYPDKIYKGGEEYLFYWDWTTWDDICNDGVQEILNIMDQLDNMENGESGYGYKFLRLGEEDTDMESRSNNWNIVLTMIRRINIPSGLEEICV